MKVSLCMNTAHGDYTFTGYPDVHLFEYTMKALRQQTFKDFEIVIADVLYESRKDYFKNHPENFEVKHVPIKPNVWTPRGQVAISTTKNTCLLYAKGEIIIFIDDSITFNEKYVEDIVKRITPEICVSNPYEVWCGDKFMGKDSNRKPQEKPIPGAYGNVSLYLERYLDLNGYDELFDGSRGLEDCDFSMRMNKAKIDIYMIDNYAIYQIHKAYPTLKEPYARCCRLMERAAIKRHSQGIIKANTVVISDSELDFFTLCANKPRGYVCPFLNVPCQSYMGNDDKCFSGNRPELLKLYKHPSLYFSLREQRKDVVKTIENLKELCKGE